ncbi:uncharacterized protein IUM83_18894 [Phytophthora cinnamomi]|uniref:uncharacterized protein n=1 Tax=Phytophthora cinnamomi TaxID=4785 RepID=UPI0035599F84|nr:hypothetical protein IUM83_18894 [Phytophthora cinnamomi]
MYRAMSEREANSLHELARGKNYWINESWDGAFQDSHRLRALVPPAEARDLTVDLERFYRTFFPDAIATEWRVLKTLPGAQDQLVKREFEPQDPEESQSVSSVPASLYLAIEENTFFYGYGSNNRIALTSERELVRLNKGDLILCRGDFMFSRAGNKKNVCVHAYIDTPQLAREVCSPPVMVPVMEDTHQVDDLFCFVWNYPYRARGECSLRKHLNKYHGFYFKRTPGAIQ